MGDFRHQMMTQNRHQSVSQCRQMFHHLMQMYFQSQSHRQNVTRYRQMTRQNQSHHQSVSLTRQNPMSHHQSQTPRQNESHYLQMSHPTQMNRHRLNVQCHPMSHSNQTPHRSVSQNFPTRQMVMSH